MLADMGLTGKVQVGNSDAGFYFNTKVLEAIDYGVNLNCLSSPLDADTSFSAIKLSNVHPWFGGVSIDDSAGWTWDFFDLNNVQPAARLPNHPEMYIAETGWPTVSAA